MNKKLEDYLKLKPIRFGVLESMHLRRTLDEGRAGDFNLTLMLCETVSADSARGRYEFVGVRELIIGDLPPLGGLFFEIQHVGDRQMEDIRFRVVEAENDAFAFWCRDFDFQILLVSDAVAPRTPDA
ncbi:MAG: hypothetical protein NTX56_18850 [Proteobacteria bacterium]|nr:hypothetical protein [Pseudomonadota bacterium]